ncbi:MAG: aldo/keto reductase [Thermoproteota archaeon]
MEYREFGKTGFKVSVIGMGTYYDPSFIVLARLFHYYKDKEFKVSALRRGLELGINMIDTAEIYETEKLVSEAIRDFKRDELFIATKVWPTHLHYNGVLKAAERSLKRLGCSYIDLYQIHFPNPLIPLEKTIRAMNRLVDEGKVRYLGVSNFSLELLKRAQEASPKYEIVSNQVEYNLLDRRIEKDLLPYCERNNIAILAYRPLAHGKLPRVLENLKISRIGDRTPAQIALNWLINRSRVVFPIPRASKPERIVENIGAIGWNLNGYDYRIIEESLKDLTRK